MYADPTLMDLAAAYAKRRNGRKTKHAVACDRPGAKAKFGTEVGRKGNKSAMITRDATGTWYAYVVQRTETGIGQAEDMLGTMRAYATEDRAKRAAIKALDTSGFSRPGAKAKMGLLDRLGAAASALAGPGKDPTTQEYKTSVTEAKKAAIDEVKNYAFMVKQNDQKLAALDAYVKSTSKAIATLNSAPEILRLTEGLRQAVKARSVLLQTLKMPFGRDGEKSSMARMDDATRRELRLFISRYVSNVKPADAERLMTAMYEKDPEHWEDQGFGKLAIAALGRNFSRPGAKAAMARWEATQTKKHGKPITEHTATINGVSYMIEKPDAMGTSATLYAWNENRGMERLATGDVDALKSRAEGMRKKEARGVAAIERLANYARPGAKAKSTHAALPPQTLEAERKPGGGSHSEAVSRKIATLINEGKPQDQAVAIALDLERRGEL